MLPQKLTIQGLYSYKKKTEIDFRDLTRAGLFGIFGPVGSGKSSILEAITYALYGNTERMNKSGDDRNYNMMNLRSDEMIIDFEFIHEGDEYRFRVRTLRNRNDEMDVNLRDRSGYRRAGDEWVPLESNDAGDVLGLDYEQFKQIVIIPQGKFNEFVNKTPGERTQMIRELFPLERFDLKGAVRRMVRGNKEQRDQLTGRLQELGEYSEEGKREIETELKQKQETQAELSKKHELARTKLSRLEAVKEELEKLQRLQEQYDALKAQKSEIENREALLGQIREAREQFKPLLDQLSEITDEMEARQERLQKIQAESEKKGKECAEINTRLDQIEEQWGDRESLKRAISQLERAIAVKEDQQRLKRKKAEAEKQRKAYEEAQQKREALSEQVSQKEEELTSLRKSVTNETALFELKESYQREKLLEDRIAEERENEEQFNEQIDQLKGRKEQAIQTLASTVSEAVEWVDCKVQECVRKITDAFEERSERMDAASTELEEHQHLAGLAHYSEHLTEGDPCPLCGGTHHPDPFTDHKAAEKTEALKQKIASLRKDRDALIEARSELLSMIDQFRNQQRQKKQLQELINQKESELEQCREEREKLDLQLDPETLEQKLEANKQLKQQIDKQENELELLKKKQQELPDPQSLRTKLDEVEKEISVIKDRIGRHEEESAEKWLTMTLDECIAAKERAMESSSKQKELSEQKTELEKSLERLKVQSSELKTALQRDEGKKEQRTKQLHSLLAKSEFESLDQIRALLAREFDVESVRREIETFRERFNRLRGQLDELEEKHQETEFDEEAYAALKTDTEELGSKLEALRGKIGELSGRLGRFTQKLKEQAELKEQQEQLENRHENLSTLNSLFRGDAFIRYVSTIYLRQLCSLANERFQKLTQNQLQLDIDDDYNFIVRDFLNDGRTRLLKTLSGGQTFQAALCLALALSEQIQTHMQVKQQFFFMDEGFGSLDKDSLSLVFDSLKQLRKEDRTVGIISHVEELQNEIDHYLYIRNHENLGSVIESNI